MTGRAESVLTLAGHEVEISDLYAMHFDPVSDRRNFHTVANAERLQQQDEEALASKVGSYAPDVQAEIDKLEWCDLLIFQFPIWWLGLPAILKGWVDRVLVLGHAYGGGRWFETGAYRGKRAMCSLTVGSRQHFYGDGGLYAPVEEILYPIHHGIFGFCGFSVLEPFVVYGPNRMSDEERAAELVRYGNALLNQGTAGVIVNP